MRPYTICLIVLLSSTCVFAQDIVVFASGTSSTITVPSPPHSATLSSYNYPTDISGLSGAKWIWDGKGWNVPCPLKIQVKDSYQVQCPNQNITFQITADNVYNFTFGTVSGFGSDWTKIDKYTIPTGRNSCGRRLNLTINAENLGTDCNAGNPAALIYSATTPDCTQCPRGSFFVPSKCFCVRCEQILVGCTQCTDAPKCNVCDTAGGFELVGGFCVCRQNFTYVPGTKTCRRNT